VTAGDLQVGGTNVCQSDGTNCGRPAADKIIICGPLLSSGTNYYQPMLAHYFGDTTLDATMGGSGVGECDSKDSTNPLVDAAVFADVPFEATGMYCKVSSSGSNGVTLTLRVEGADATPSLACTIATGTTECFTGTDTTTDIGAGDQISVRSVTTEDLSAHDAWCLLYMELK